MKNSESKIALFIPSLRGGGAERVFVNLANEFSNRGLNVDLILTEKVGPYIQNLSREINIVDLNSKRALSSLFPLIKYIKKEEIDVLISALPHLNIITILANTFSLNKVKVIVTEHNYFSEEQKSVSFLKRVITKLFIKLIYGKAKAVVAVSQGVADDLVENISIKRSNLYVIYNPINIEIISKESKKEVEHKWLKNKKRPVILSVGRLTKQKDFPTLIKAFAKLREKKEIKLIILGEGEDREKLEILIKELKLENDINMRGFVDNPYSYMLNSDVFVLSSIYEGFGNVLVEAMACGTPIVSTDCLSGPAEILENGEYGRLVPVGDINALVRAIKETLKNPIDKKIIQERAKYFSTENAVEKYLKLINE